MTTKRLKYENPSCPRQNQALTRETGLRKEPRCAGQGLSLVLRQHAHQGGSDGVCPPEDAAQ